MNISILDFEIKPTARSIALVFVRYGDLIMKCEVVYTPKYNKVWIRMPENWFSKTKKIKYCYWPDEKISDNYQEIVLKKIEEKYHLDQKKFIEIFNSGKRSK